jgi:hypothetical protein
MSARQPGWHLSLRTLVAAFAVFPVEGVALGSAASRLPGGGGVLTAAGAAFIREGGALVGAEAFLTEAGAALDGGRIALGGMGTVCAGPFVMNVIPFVEAGDAPETKHVNKAKLMKSLLKRNGCSAYSCGQGLSLAYSHPT